MTNFEGCRIPSEHPLTYASIDPLTNVLPRVVVTLKKLAQDCRRSGPGWLPTTTNNSITVLKRRSHLSLDQLQPLGHVLLRLLQVLLHQHLLEGRWRACKPHGAKWSTAARGIGVKRLK